MEKRTVPKERVRMSKDTHEDECEVSEEVRNERIEVDDKPRGKAPLGAAETVEGARAQAGPPSAQDMVDLKESR